MSSNLSQGQHKQLLFAISEYLKRLTASGSAGIVSDVSKLATAISSLESAADLTSSNASSYVIHPHTLESIFASAGIAQPQPPAAASTSSAANSDFEAKFAKYLAVLKGKGYFKAAVEGTDEYEQLVQKARAKLMERTGPPTASTSSESPKLAATVITDEAKEEAENLKNQGNVKLQAKEFDEAIRLYSEAIRLNPTSPIYLANRAAAYSQSGDHHQAIEDSKKAISLDPNYAKAYSRLGLAYFSLGKYKESIEEGYEKAIALEPNNNLTKEALAKAREKLTASSASSTSSSGNDQAQPEPGAAGGMPNLASMMSGLGNMFGGGPAAGGTGGPSDFGSLFSNPQFMQMAQQISQSPQFQQLVQQVSPDLLNNLRDMNGGPRPPGANQ